jgi:hypothetical protein
VNQVKKPKQSKYLVQSGSSVPVEALMHVLSQLQETQETETLESQLFTAAEQGNADKLEVLLELPSTGKFYYSFVNIPDLTRLDSDGKSILHHAAAHNRKDFIEKLTKQQLATLLEIKDSSGMNPLWCAVKEDAGEAVQILLDAGSTITGYDTRKYVLF